VKDQVFSGKDVAEAVAAAARALAVPEAHLRYVVLDAGTAGVRGGSGTAARIAVLLDSSGGTVPAAAPEPEAATADPRAGLAQVIQAVARAARVEIAVTIDETDDALVVRLTGDGCEFLLQDDAEVLDALEHLLQRAFGRAVGPRRLALDCAGQRQKREDALRQTALELAEQVRTDGIPRTTRPLNSYERRLIHVAIGDLPGLKTFSVGEGADRRVTIAPASAEPGED
jgi:spoIIIJ-associated protein